MTATEGHCVMQAGVRAGESVQHSVFACKAVLLDLDGVVTSTATAHEAAWKTAFDEVLSGLPASYGGDRRSFDTEDYGRHVDGKPRKDGVRAFLRSRGIELPEGKDDDPPGYFTVAGLARRKNDLFRQELATGGAEVFPDAAALIGQLRARGISTAIVSASRNCLAVLRAAGIEHLFDARIDGVIASREGLAGKPSPDTFLAAARRLGVEPPCAAVIEDSTAGVTAARAGSFGLVIGVDRSGPGKELLAHGADMLVHNLGELVRHGRDG